MKYYVIIPNGNYECLFIEENTFPISKYHLSCGIDLSKEKIEEITVKYPVTARITDWACVIPNVVTERFKEIIEQVNCNGIQFLPFLAEREDGKEFHRMYVINNLSMPNALDLEKSIKFKNWKPGDLLIKPAVKESLLNNLDIFYLPFTNGSVYISEKLAKMVKASKLTGFELTEIKNTDKDTHKDLSETKDGKLLPKSSTSSLQCSCFNEWLDAILATYDIQTHAFCFNLYENTDNKYSVELVGTNSFRLEDEDWACDEIYSSRNHFPEYAFAETNWKKAVKIVGKEINNYLKNGKYADKLKQTEGVACGFVDGDLNIIYKK